MAVRRPRCYGRRRALGAASPGLTPSRRRTRRRDSARRARRGSRGDGPGRRRRSPGHGRPLPLRRRRLRGGRRAGVGLLRPRRAGPWSGRAGHRAALRDREPAAGRPVVVRRAALGRPRPGDSRRGLRRGAGGAGAEPRAGEEGQDLPRDELGDESLRLERAGDRQQRRPERRPPRAHGARLPGGRLGRHHPALRVPGQGRQAPDLPGLQLDRGRAGDLQERLRAAHAAEAQAGRSRSSSASSRRTAASSPTGATRTRTAPPSSATGDQNTFSPGPPNRGQPTAFAAGRVEDAFQVEFDGSALTWSLTGNTETASSGLDSGAPAARSRSRSALVPTDDPGRFALEIDGEVAGGAEAVGDGGSTGTIAVAAGSRTVSETAAPGTKLGDYTIETVCRNGDTVVASSGGHRRSRSPSVGATRSSAPSRTTRSRTARASPPRSTASSSRTAPTTSRTGAIATAARTR